MSNNSMSIAEASQEVTADFWNLFDKWFIKNRKTLKNLGVPKPKPAKAKSKAKPKNKGIETNDATVANTAIKY